jgi:UDP-4-amino-4,6-dideoxy-N-acetyl-beta-L-altrosamine transaminase
MIPYARQSISSQDVDAVVEVLKSDWLTQGPTVPRFELAVAERVGAEYAVAVNSATSALHVACLALELGPGDRLWTSPNTFVASANCALYCGADVDFVDINPRTYNMSVESLAAKLEGAERLRTLPKVLVPTHFAGQSCEAEAMHTLAKRYGVKIIEDASHAIGGLYRDLPVGNCAYSDIAVFSFHPAKIITSGEGGMALTNNRTLAESMRRLRTHGITRDRAQMLGPIDGIWSYEQHELGFNYRMTDIQAALGLSQHSRIAEFVSRRREIARIYDEALASLPLILPFQHPDTASAFHLYVVKIDPARTSIDRSTLFDAMRAAGINVNVHYIPVHTQPYYKRKGFRHGQYPEAEAYYSHALSLPMFATLRDDDIGRVVATLRAEFMK